MKSFNKAAFQNNSVGVSSADGPTCDCIADELRSDHPAEGPANDQAHGAIEGYGKKAGGEKLSSGDHEKKVDEAANRG